MFESDFLASSSVMPNVVAGVLANSNAIMFIFSLILELSHRVDALGGLKPVAMYII